MPDHDAGFDFLWRLDSLAALAAIGPVMILAIGGFVMSQSVRLNGAIEEELLRLATEPDVDIQRLPGTDQVATGWNTLIQRLSNQSSWDRLERRLAESVGRMHQDRLETVFNHVPLAIGVTDLEGRIIRTTEPSSA